MANFNKVLLAGNLTRDPQLSHLPSNMAVVEFGMAINRKWRSQAGEMKEEVTFVDIRAYGRQAETLNQYMTKGKPIFIEGRLKFDSWESKEGQKRSKLYVIVDTFQFIGGPPGGAGGAGANRGGDRYERTERPAPSARSSGGGNSAPMDEMPPIDETVPAGDDIPF